MNRITKIMLAGLLALTLQTRPQFAIAVSCKDYSSCAQAVKNWCEGRHPRADGDNDGIPCENVCPSLDIVNQIRQEIDC